MVCFARNVLASENTKMIAPEYYKPEWENSNYYGEEKPYEFSSQFEKIVKEGKYGNER